MTSDSKSLQSRGSAASSSRAHRLDRKAPGLLLGLGLAASLLVAPGPVQAWDPLDPLACNGAFFAPPADHNICRWALKNLTIGDVGNYLNVGCEPLLAPSCIVCCAIGYEACAIAGQFQCIVPEFVTQFKSYVLHYDELTCSLDLNDAGEIFEDVVSDNLELAATGGIGALNQAFYATAGAYLDAVECAHGKPIPQALKNVMIALRDASGFSKEQTFFDDDLDTIRIVSEDDVFFSLSKRGLTLGHLVILRDTSDEPLHPIALNWSYNLAYVQAGNLCPAERTALRVIMHEAVHVRQYRNIGQASFVDRWLADVLRNGYRGSASESEAFTFSGNEGPAPVAGTIAEDLIGFRNAHFMPHGTEPPGCGPAPDADPAPPPAGSTVASNGAPSVSFTACGAVECAPDLIECDGAHAAVVHFAGSANDPDGIQATEWLSIDSNQNETSLGTGNTLTLSLASRFGTGSGRHLINFKAVDGASPAKTATTEGVINVVDTQGPLVTPRPAPDSYECATDHYTEQGADAADVCDPSPIAVVVGGEAVDTTRPDAYEVTYEAVDDVGNVGSATRTVTVVDTTNPTLDAPPEIVTQDRTPNLGTPIMSDLCTTPVAHNDAPAIFPYGTTVVTWWSTDAAGNESARDTQTVTVLGGDASSAGRDFSCDLSRDGQVYCWGADDAGQLGDGANVDRWGPRAIDMTSVARQVSVGARHACAVKADGSVQCWGSGQDGRLGRGGTADSNVPVTVSGVAGAVQVSAGGQVQLFVDDGHACVVLDTGAVKCWGEGSLGQLGDSTSTDRFTPVTAQLPAGTSAMQVTAGGAHSCAVDSIGRAFCWGAGANGRLGNGTNNNRAAPQQVTFPAGVQAVQIDAGERHTCAVDVLGTVWCWGSGANGRLGNNSLQDRSSPVPVTLPDSAVQVSAGVAHSCALLTDGRVFCWGSPLSGRLGDGTVIFDQLVPIQSAGVANAVQVSAGSDHTCARLFSGGSLRDVCWGDNNHGELGDGTSVARATQVQISTLCDQTGFYPPSAGAAASCIIGRGAADPSTAMCWGSNGSGQLGEGTGASRRAPTPVVGTASSPLAAAGGWHGCALTATNGVQCWGSNLFGQLGDGTLLARQTPVAISGGGSWSFVATGANHSCGITGGQVKCWGANTNGQIGDGTIFPRLTPTAVSGLPGSAMYLDLGDTHSCAVVQNGANREVWCWGGNLHGQLGNGFPFDSWLPVRAGTIADAWMVSAGANHTCATTTSGPVFCWGQSLLGQVGNSVVFFDAWAPETVLDAGGAPLSAPFSFVSAGGSHSCVAPVGAMQQAACWGNNLLGQLGNGGILPNPRAQIVPGLAFVSSVSAGDNHTCARVSSTGTVCWGDNSSGQLGDGTVVNRSMPVRAVGACY